MFVINANNKPTYQGGTTPTSGCFTPAIDGSTLNLYLHYTTFDIGNTCVNSNVPCYALCCGFQYSAIITDAMYPNIYLCTCTNNVDTDGYRIEAYCTPSNYCSVEYSFNALCLTPLKKSTIGKKICHNLYVYQTMYSSYTRDQCGNVDLCVLKSNGNSVCVATLLDWCYNTNIQRAFFHCGYSGACNVSTGLPTIITTTGTQVDDGDMLYLHFHFCTSCRCTANSCRVHMGIFNGVHGYVQATNSASCGVGYACSFINHTDQLCRTFPIQISVE